MPRMRSNERSLASDNTAAPASSPNWLLYVLAIGLAAGAFMVGVQAGQMQSISQQEAGLFSWLFNRAERPAEEADLGEFWRVWNLLEEKYVAASSTDPLTPEQKIQGAIAGLVDAYNDPYTVYLPPAESEVFEEQISGNFSGVGMEVGLRDGLITVIAPLPDTPAANAGLMPGDVIVRIDDTSTERMRIDEAVQLIRGEEGTDVTFTLYREGETEFKTITVTRDTINIPTVETEIRGDTFILSLYSFNAIAEERVEEAMQEYLSSGAENFILDLRGNPGGYLQSAVTISGYFLPSGKIVVREQTGEGEEIVFRSPGSRITDRFNPDNFVVLVDNGSASASEILAGALKDHQVATLIGVSTFGKGSVQELVSLPGDASLKVTIARWLTPNGTSISNGGLSPDINFPISTEDRQLGNDTQLQAALDFLQGEEVASEDFLEQFEQIGS